ncbi:MAG: carbamoyl-phosphate synthase large subunit, partial [Clostridia bacterium]|nr:carbamoyl-phosphate synthase large subunit [Clostridia bacterium]
YPIAKISTRIALGYRLNEIKNEVTGKTCACFEPALDYVVVKLPKWSFEKFEGASRRLGTQMKATGEVMSISTSFESAMMKAVRGAELKTETLNLPYQRSEDIIPRLRSADDRRIFTVFEALKKGVSPDEIFEITKIDRFFLYKLRNLADFENRIAGKQPDENDYSEAKRLGYTDRALEEISGHGVAGLHRDAVYRIVDTCAAEFSAETPYFYSTYDERCESRSFRKSGRPVIIVLGSGPIRIGQGIEFDYSSVHCVMTLRSLGYDVVIINNNPETVSTDYDTADRLYFEPLTPEDVMNVIKAENPVGVVVAFGGQTSIKLTKYLSENGVRILGTSASGIDLAEDRERFDELLEKYGIKRPVGTSVLTEEEALSAAERIGYPVLLRPSYVIGGQNMSIIHNAEEAHHYMRRILETGIENPVLVDKYMMGIELEVDVISDGRDVLIPGIMEHIERAGVHSGDSIAVYPPYNINDGMIDRVVKCSETLALSLGTQGLVNIQYLIYENELYVIEVNPRASRTVPYISKVTGVPMVDIASRVMLGQSLASLGYKSGLYGTPPYYAVKVPVFSFEKLTDANAYLGPEMKSTGEVLGVGKTLREALFKGLKSAGFDVGRSNRSGTPGVLISVEHRDMQEAVALAKKYDDLGFAIYATSETAGEIRSLGTDVITTPDVDDREKLFSLLESGAINYIVYTGAVYDSTERDYIALHRKALTLGILCMTSLDTANALADTIAGRFNENNTELVDINNMRREKTVIGFTKMQGTGDDYIFIDNRDGAIDCPESLCPTLCDRHYGVGAYGIVLIENSDVADCSMRVFNRDGSEGFMAGNAVRCVGKYLFDNGIVTSPDVTVETASGVRKLHMIIRNSAVTYVSVEMGAPVLSPASIPCTLGGDSVVARPYTVNGTEYEITCLSVGNPHCVVFCDRTDAIDVRRVGPYFENADIFPERVNTEFVHVVNRNTLKMRAYERGNGETAACGTGACAAAYAAILNGFCRFGTDIVVKTRGGDLTVNCRPDGIILSGNAETVFRGFFEY